MAFPTSPTNGQQANINGITYTYSNTVTAWTVSTSVSNSFVSISVSGNVNSGNVLATGVISATGNVLGGNLVVTGNISANNATFTSNQTLSYGTANGVVYLNSNKVATSGTALVFDGTNLGLPVTPSAWETTLGTRAIQFTGGAVLGYRDTNIILTQNAYFDGAFKYYASSIAAGYYGIGSGVHAWFTAPSGTAGNAITFTQAMTLDSSGNLGIGTTSPAYKLDISSGNNTRGFNLAGATTGYLFGQISNTGGQLILGVGDGSTGALFGGMTAYASAIGSNNATPFQIATNGTIKATLDSSGNLGLGVTPSAWSTSIGLKALQVSASGCLYSYTFGGNNFTAVSDNTFINSAGNGAYIATNTASQYKQTAGEHQWFNAPSGTAGNAISFTQAMTLDSSGNLGIGTTSPTYKLNVVTSDTTVAAFRNPGAAISQSLVGNTAGDLSLRVLASGDSLIFSDTSKYLAFGSSGATERFRISSDGTFRVKGAGTAGSTDAFQVAGTAPADAARIDSSGNLLVGSTYGAGVQVYFANTDGVNSRSGAAAGNARSLYTGYYSATTSTAGTLSFNVTTNGNVTNTNNSYGPISDVKLKENIVDVTPKLEKLLQVRIVNYNLKANLGYESHKQIGVIAQELEQVFPGLVDESPDRDEEGNDLGTTTKSVKMSVFVPMLIKAMQEQQALITQLTARITALETA